MAKTPAEAVNEYVSKLEEPLKTLVEAVRHSILETDPIIGEHIKWNAPAYYYNGEMKEFDAKEYKRDLVVMNLRKGNVLLIFPTGNVIDDGTEILEGNYSDGRRIITIGSVEDLIAKKSSLQRSIRSWLSKVD